jgi:hypothetical protein
MSRDNIPLPETAIEDFLGPEICNSALVRDSKLTEAERAQLEAPLSIEELDNSVKKAKIRSAPGADGFNSRLILACWKYLRRPLFNYCTATNVSGLVSSVKISGEPELNYFQKRGTLVN